MSKDAMFMDPPVLNQNRKICIEAFRQHLKHGVLPFKCRMIAQACKLNDILTQEQMDNVDRQSDDKVFDTFLDYLLHSNDSGDKRNWYSTFLEGLKKNDLISLVDMLEGNEVENFNCKLWEQSLALHFHDFVADFDIEPILIFYGRELLGDFEREVVVAQPTRTEKCYKFCTYISEKQNWFPKLIEALKDERCGNLQHWVEKLDPDGDLKGAVFVNLMNVCSPIISGVLEPNDILDLMNCINPQTKDAIKAKQSREARCRMFLKILVAQKQGWFKQFVAALGHPKHKSAYSEIVDLLEPTPLKSKSNTAKQRDELTTTVKVVGSPSNENQLQSAGPSSFNKSKEQEASSLLSKSQEDDTETLKMNIDEGPSSDGKLQSTIPMQCDPPAPSRVDEPYKGQNDLNIVDTSEDQDQEQPMDEGIEVQLRDYQLELARPALCGNNCMIVAPTGSGKTYVALKICLEHIKKFSAAKVIFLVPRVPLVKQQYSLFKRHLGDEPNVIFQVTGESSSNVPVHISLRKHMVTFMTAQILMNILSDGLMEINEISLLIFDECHHTVKNDPYSMIMRVYLDKRLNQENETTSGVKLPQIIGLTASPGMGKAKTMTKAEDNIKTLMANLDVTTAPVQVKTSDAVDDLKVFQHEAQDEVIAVAKRSGDEFCTKIKAAMHEIQEMIKRDLKKYENTLENRLTYDLRSAPGSQDYESWAVNLLNKSKLIKDEKTSQYFMAYATHLREYNTSLMLNDHVRSSDAKEYLLEKLFKKKPTNIVETIMRDVYEKHEPRILEDTNPMLDQLKKKLLQEFIKKIDSRCIIFAKTRAIAIALVTFLCEWRESDQLNLNPKLLTGAGARFDSGGMTKVGQDDTLEAFQDGRCKVIVATSVAEEGLDIKACNLIITYNYSTNEVGQVQRKGRGRAKESKVIMLAYSDSGHVKRERENTIRVELTHDILATIQGLEPRVLKSQIRKIQLDLKKEREFEKAVQQYKSKQKKPDPGIYNLSCLWCKKLATTSDKFRHINRQHRVVVDPEFAKKACFKEVPEGNEGTQIGDEQFVIGKIYCKNQSCQREWGLRMRYKSCPISVLRIPNFLITNGKGYRAVKKQWKDAPFVVDKELKETDLAVFFPGSTDAQPDEEEAVEDQDYKMPNF